MTASAAKPRVTHVRVRPKVSLLGNAFAAIMLGTTPLFAVIYWFTASRGGMWIAVVVHVCVITVALLLFWRQLRVFCAVTDDELIGNGIFTTLVRVPLDRVHRVLLIPTYLGAAPSPVLQLLVTDAEGRRLFRMRGSYWHTNELLMLARALPVPLEEVPEVISMREMFATYPGSAYWYENRRPLLAVAAVVGIVGGLAATAWFMGLLGLPVRIL